MKPLPHVDWKQEGAGGGAEELREDKLPKQKQAK